MHYDISAAWPSLRIGQMWQQPEFAMAVSQGLDCCPSSVKQLKPFSHNATRRAWRSAAMGVDILKVSWTAPAVRFNHLPAILCLE
jgi:hypothetical protein